MTQTPPRSLRDLALWQPMWHTLCFSNQTLEGLPGAGSASEALPPQDEIEE